MKIYNRGKFHQYSLCGCQVKNFQSFAYRFSIHEKALFGNFLRFYSPKYGPNLPNVSPEVVLQQTKTLKKYFFEGFRVFMEKGRTQSLTFGFVLKMTEIDTRQSRKTSAIELSKYVKIKALSCLPFQEKYNYLLHYLNYFWQETGRVYTSKHQNQKLETS